MRRASRCQLDGAARIGVEPRIAGLRRGEERARDRVRPGEVRRRTGAAHDFEARPRRRRGSPADRDRGPRRRRAAARRRSRVRSIAIICWYAADGTSCGLTPSMRATWRIEPSTGTGIHSERFISRNGNRCSFQPKRAPCGPPLRSGWCARTIAWRSPASRSAAASARSISASIRRRRSRSGVASGRAASCSHHCVSRKTSPRRAPSSADAGPGQPSGGNHLARRAPRRSGSRASPLPSRRRRRCPSRDCPAPR